MLRFRLIFGTIFIAALLLIFWVDSRLDYVVLSGAWSDLFGGRSYLPSGLALLGLSVGVIPFAAWELTRILRANDVRARTWLTCFAAELGLLLHFAMPYSTDAAQAVAIVGTALVAMFLLALFWFSRERRVEGVVAAAGGTMFGMIYLGFMLGFLLSIRRWESAWVVLAIVLITKSCDIGAYFTGRAIGRHKLIPWLSPGKTWEGLLGGIVLAVCVASLLAWWGRSLEPVVIGGRLVYDHSFSAAYAALAGALLAVAGQIGDLMASLFKRDAGLKDSSRLLPGFGGVLDVLDSPLLAGPVAYWLLAAVP
ncbi:MAG: phosphatidate cytidylyltransferase [Phycisphaerales bacterium]|nr:phosphatidate cytidylyltransferase [Phycisphaerales bacterium]